MESKIQEEIIAEAACISEQIEDIALCATIASRSIPNPDDRDQHIMGVLYGIISLSKVINAKLNSIADD